MKEKTTELTAALDALQDMVRQHCEDAEGVLDSLAIIANANAMQILAKHGRLKVYFPDKGKSRHQWLLGKWVE